PGLPPYAAVPHLRGGTDNFFHYAAYLGGGSNPFITESDPNNPAFKVKNLSLGGELTFDRLEGRRAVLESLDRMKRDAHRRAADMRGHHRRPFDPPPSKDGPTASDITREPARLRDPSGRHTFGQSALLARRLVEAGVTFVTVNCVPWDHHGTPPQLKTE